MVLLPAGAARPDPDLDCRTHLGCADPDRSCFGVDELLGALAAADGRAVVIPLAEPDGYRAANDRMLAATQAAEGRLVAFGLGDPVVRRILAMADECRLPVIVHAGRGIPSLGRDALELARAYPRAPLIRAHATIADLAWIWRKAAGQPYLFFDTAWWNTADQLAPFALVPPGQIPFASDTPYGRTIAIVAGGQLERLPAGAKPLDLGPAPTAPAPRPGQLLERVHTLLVAAAIARTPNLPIPVFGE